MTDAVTISLIGAFSSFAAASIGMLNNILGRRNSMHIEQTKTAIVTLEKQTNSIKDALVKVTGEAERAKGVLEGKAIVAEDESLHRRQERESDN